MTITFAESCELDEVELEILYHNLTEDANQTSNFTFSEFMANHSEACSIYFVDALVSWIVPIIFTIVCVVGFFGNLLVILVVIFYQQMRNTTNILILNLATADLLFIVTCIPPTAIDYAMGWPLNDLSCKVVQYLINVTTYGSVYTLVLLSFDRYLAVVYPVKSISWRTQLNTTFAIAAIWMFTLTTCVPIYFLYDTKDITHIGQEGNRTICTFNRDSYDEICFQASVFVTMLVLPLLMILWLYMNMLVRLWRGSAATHGPGPSRDTRNKCKGKENKLRVTRMIIVVIIVFAICWTPLQVVLLLKSLQLYDIGHSGLVIFQIITHCLAYCNSCLNPILYAFFSPNFRSAFRAVSGGGMNPPQFGCPRNKNGTFGSNQLATNNRSSSRRKSRKRTATNSPEVGASRQVERLELNVITPRPLNEDTEQFPVKRHGSDAFAKVERAGLPEDSIKRRHSWVVSNESLQNLTSIHSLLSSRRNSMAVLDLGPRRHSRPCFASTNIEMNVIQSTIQNNLQYI